VPALCPAAPQSPVLVHLVLSLQSTVDPGRSARANEANITLRPSAAEGRVQGMVQMSIRREPRCFVAQDATRPGFLLVLAISLPTCTVIRLLMRTGISGVLRRCTLSNQSATQSPHSRTPPPTCHIRHLCLNIHHGRNRAESPQLSHLLRIGPARQTVRRTLRQARRGSHPATSRAGPGGTGWPTRTGLRSLTSRTKPWPGWPPDDRHPRDNPGHQRLNQRAGTPVGRVTEPNGTMSGAACTACRVATNPRWPMPWLG
jgi:hypothetical protein